MLVDLKKHSGRVFVELKDSYGKAFDVYESSAASGNFIWLNTRASVQILASQAGALGVETKETNGWVNYPLPEGCCIGDAIHLSKKDAKELIKVLRHFVKTGGLDGLA